MNSQVSYEDEDTIIEKPPEDFSRRRSIKEWLLAPTASGFKTPTPAGSLTELSKGVYTYKGNPETLLIDLQRCNRALHKLLVQNAQLKRKLAGVDETRFRAIGVQVNWGQDDGDDSLDSEMQTLLKDDVPRNLDVLSRVADQETAIAPYRERLAALTSVVCHLQSAVRALHAREGVLLNTLAHAEESHVAAMYVAEQECVALLQQLQVQKEEARRTSSSLSVELRDTEKRAHQMKNKADARIAELNLVISTFHLDIDKLMTENDLLREQLLNQRAVQS